MLLWVAQSLSIRWRPSCRKLVGYWSSARKPISSKTPYRYLIHSRNTWRPTQHQSISHQEDWLHLRSSSRKKNRSLPQLNKSTNIIERRLLLREPFESTNAQWLESIHGHTVHRLKKGKRFQWEIHSERINRQITRTFGNGRIKIEATLYRVIVNQHLRPVNERGT